MKILSWNCQGAASNEFLRVARDIFRRHSPDFFTLIEPRISGTHADMVCRKMGFKNWTRVEALGYSGGIWVLWNEKYEASVVYTHPQFIMMEIILNSKEKVNIAFVYGSPSYTLRRKLWPELNKRKMNMADAWLTVGDFNSVVAQHEVSNQSTFNSQRSSDLGYVGPKFTWTRGLTAENFKGARLDRALCTLEWFNMFANTTVTHLPSVNSDHTPVLIQMNREGMNKVNRRFTFQAAWTLHKDFMNVMNNNWDEQGNLAENNENIKSLLTQ